MLSSLKTILLAIPILLGLMACEIMSAFDCFNLRHNTRYYMDIYILESAPPYSKFQSISSSQISKLHKFPGLNNDIKEYYSSIYTSDLSTLIAENGFDISLINMSSENRKISPFTDSDIITRDETGLSLLGFFYYQPQSKEFFINLNEFVEDQVAYYKIKSSSLVKLNPNTLAKDTLLTFEGEFNDSLFVEKDISRIIYSTHQQLIIFELNETTYSLDTPNQKPDYWTREQVESTLYTLNQFNEINTLYAFDKKDYLNYYWMQVTDDYLIYEEDDSLQIINFDGTSTNKILGNRPKSYSGINSFTYNKGKRYYNIDENYSLDLSKYVENISSANPYEDVILITESNTKLHLFSIIDKKVIQTINLNNLPSINYKKDNFNTTGLYHPLLTKDNKLHIIYIHSYYYDDPNDDCEI